MNALSIRQPYAEAILSGRKTIEYRSRATTIVGVRFYIYACKRAATDYDGRYGDFDVSKLPRGQLVGTCEIVKCEGGQWHLGRVKRLSRPRAPRRHPQPTWFRPF